MGAWVPGRAVPWCLGRLPWAPGAPPRGSQGGGPGGKFAGRWWSCLLWIRIKNHVDFDVDFWSSWGPSWVPLGGHFRSCWRLFRPKLVSEPSSNRLIFEKVIFHETLRFPMVLDVFSPKMAAQDGPRSLQDESKIVLDRFF